MPRYRYQQAPGERIHAATFRGTPEEFAAELARDWRAGGRTPDVRVWTGPITEPPAATAR
ncbi:hypothetical protein [Kitasatospora cheerisanensis]|uniref:Uncharacterized protein n=1 Tax=Kitasatospora cheerisanensis KCTC 2395 TaxID=1348663 RepID=A0A066YWN6_9ACTN|nr:hypothetical protein [Kitasatospora cheerisanensis]KDN84389.1 hypothetical protein KCH_41800 [Kitasatospora cheerisanensis KCTC 2395]